MSSEYLYVVNLTDPKVLEQTLTQYLSMGVCPVLKAAFPGALVTVTLQLRLPKGSEIKCSGRVIQQIGADAFLVQLAGILDLKKLGALTGSEEKPPPQDEEAGEEDEQEEEKKAKVTGYETEYSDVYNKMKDLSMGEKQRLARYGNRTVRQLLSKEPNKNLHVLVMKNVKVTLDEAMEYSKRPNFSPDALRVMSQNRTFTSSRQLIFNLVRNPSCPMDVATRLLQKLTINEWRIIAKSPSVRLPITAAAKKLMMQRLDRKK